MRLFAAAVLLLAASVSPCVAAPITIEQNMRGDVGKQFWVEQPDGVGLEFCSTAFPRSPCGRISNTSFTVQAITDAGGGAFYKIKTVDGKTGFVSWIRRDRFLSRPLSGDEHAAVSNCETAGPAVGMAKDALLACWGQPSRTNTTTTAAGTAEQMVYARRGYVYVTDGRVTAIQTTQR